MKVNLKKTHMNPLVDACHVGMLLALEPRRLADPVGGELQFAGFGILDGGTAELLSKL
jgi:hypothetical protein